MFLKDDALPASTWIAPTLTKCEAAVENWKCSLAAEFPELDLRKKQDGIHPQRLEVDRWIRQHTALFGREELLASSGAYLDCRDYRRKSSVDVAQIKKAAKVTKFFQDELRLPMGVVSLFA